MQHLEFIDKDHFDSRYHRKYATGKLSNFIDFCWETDFNLLFATSPEGFSDVLFPNIGYTYLINLGTPFVIQLGSDHFEVKSNGFLPRHRYITCHHSMGNKLFGIKFKVCPVLFEKDVDFSEYKERIFPLAYLINKSIVDTLQAATDFAKRVDIVFEHYADEIEKCATLKMVSVVTGIIKECDDQKQFGVSIVDIAEKYKVSKRTLQRYFEVTTGFSTKPALQTLRIRSALKQLADEQTFDYHDYGYHDYSHFIRHLKSFTGTKYIKDFQVFYNKKKRGSLL